MVSIFNCLAFVLSIHQFCQNISLVGDADVEVWHQRRSMNVSIDIRPLAVKKLIGVKIIRFWCFNVKMCAHHTEKIVSNDVACTTSTAAMAVNLICNVISRIDRHSITCINTNTCVNRIPNFYFISLSSRSFIQFLTLIFWLATFDPIEWWTRLQKHFEINTIHYTHKKNPLIKLHFNRMKVEFSSFESQSS